ncbi:MAG: Ig-like domain-containing protein [Clostridia bacterium]|nr:Ig-like domain-containing protein [Clostridia bacterium]
MNIIRHRAAAIWVCLLLAGICLLGGAAAEVHEGSSFGTLNGDEKMNAVYMPTFIMNSWYYLPENLPEGATVKVYGHVPSLKALTGPESETAVAGSIDYRSGDESLMPAVYFSDAEGQTAIYVDPGRVDHPGEVTLRFRLKSEHYYAFMDATLLILSWEEDPAFEVENPSREANIQANRAYRDIDLVNLFVREKAREVAEKYGRKADNGKYTTFSLTFLGDNEGLVEWSQYSDPGAAKPSESSNFLIGTACQVPEYGDYTLNLECRSVSFDVLLRALPYWIEGGETVKPGSAPVYQVIDAQPDTGRTFSWTLEGEGMTFDPDTGTLTVPEGTPEGASFTLTAAPSDGGSPVTLRGTVTSTVAATYVYQMEDAAPSAADAAITVSAKGGATALTAGKSLQMQAAFSNPDKVNRKQKNDGIEWSVEDAESGLAPEGVTIDKRGNLKADKSVSQLLKLRVIATSTAFQTRGTLDVTVVPQVVRVELEPEEVFFYTGFGGEQLVRARLIPESVPTVGITWTPSKKGVVEIAVDPAYGTAVLRPVAAGKTTVTVKEPGGKSAKLNVNVTDPVTGVTLSGSGKPAAGGTVTLKAALTPKSAGNKNVEWSLDVGEDVATVNEKGQVKISKDAPAGTVINVTCTALGAPTPVEAIMQIQVR